jgi:hypothetical protein
VAGPLHDLAGIDEPREAEFVLLEGRAAHPPEPTAARPAPQPSAARSTRVLGSPHGCPCRSAVVGFAHAVDRQMSRLRQGDGGGPNARPGAV